MNKRDFSVVGNEGTDNQEFAKGIAFVKSRRAELNVVQMVESMRDQAMPNGVIINDVYCDRSMTRDYDREALNAFFATLKEEDFEVVVVRSLNEITDDIYDLEEFVKTITDMAYGSILLKSVRCQLLYLMQRILDANGILWQSDNRKSFRSDKQVPAVKDCRFTQTAFGTVVHDSSGKWRGQYETEDAAVEMIREMAQDIGGYDDEI